MRVAALYDIHGNLPALSVVLSEIGDVDVVLVGGDVLWGRGRRKRWTSCAI
jgi:Icc-related predicted phosphoesterase